MPQYRGLLPGSLPSQALEQGAFLHSLPGHTGSLWIISCSVSAKAQISRGLCASCSGLLTSYPGGSFETHSLVTGINITSALYSHNCAASPIPPPDPICQTVSVGFDRSFQTLNDPEAINPPNSLGRQVNCCWTSISLRKASPTAHPPAQKSDLYGIHSVYRPNYRWLRNGEAAD